MKMDNVAKSGRTILFVSHQMNAIAGLCNRAIWIENGGVREDLPAKETVQSYLQHSEIGKKSKVNFVPDTVKPAQGIEIRIMNKRGILTDNFLFNEDIKVQFLYTVRERLADVYLCALLFNSEGILVFVSYDFDHEQSSTNFNIGKHGVGFTIPGKLMSPGMYSLSFRIGSHYQGKLDDSDYERDNNTMCSFIVEDYESRRGNDRKGTIAPRLLWYLSDHHEELEDV